MNVVTIEHPEMLTVVKKTLAIAADTHLTLSGQRNGHSGILKVSNSSGSTWRITLPAGGYLEENSPYPIEVKDGDNMELTWTVDNDSVDWNYQFFQVI